MVYRPRTVMPLVPHHIVSKGNRAKELFRDDTDRIVFLSLFEEAIKKHGLRVWGYCLMTNHVHIVGVPASEDALPMAMWELNNFYARYFNHKYDVEGHLFKNRFFSCPMDGYHTAQALLYVDLNPVRAGIVPGALSYRWSSARAHAEVMYDRVLDPHFRAQHLFPDWREALTTRLRETAVASIRNATRRTVYCGDRSYPQLS